ncbi:MAG: glyoxalase superfamily protein [Terriglobales bacterium]
MSSANSETPAPAAIAFEGVCPILRVKSLSESVQYYVKTLGFKIDWGYPDDGSSFIASVSRGRCHIFLSEGD